MTHPTEPTEPPHDTAWYRGAIEAVLMVADEPVAPTDLATALDLPVDQVETICQDLATEYRGESEAHLPRGFELRSVGGGWRIYSAPAFADVVERFCQEGHTARLTQAALETLAIVAYRGPISRGRIGAIRGVSADSAVRTLISRGLIDEVGTDETSGARLYATTQLFLERLGLTSLDALEPLAPRLPGVEALDEIEEHPAR